MELRRYRAEDLADIVTLFYETVHAVNSKDYNQTQLNAWANGHVDLVQWGDSLRDHMTVVALENGRLIGFGDATSNGYLDRLYVHKDFQGQGVAKAICDKLESAVTTDLWVTHASLTAKPFFLRRGYIVVKAQQVVRDGVSMTNFLMHKTIDNMTK